MESEELLKQIEGLARIQCTQREAAAVLRVHQDTFGDFLRSHEKAKQAWDDGQSVGRVSLRRMQYKIAETGNPTMQIWLGKQWLDQRDKSDSHVTVTSHEEALSALEHALGTDDDEAHVVPN